VRGTYQPAFAGRGVLDLGVGTERTTRYLAPLARTNVCVDSSPPMVDDVHAHFPGISVYLADMRNLSAFGDGAFDFVFAACNLIDDADDETSPNPDVCRGYPSRHAPRWVSSGSPNMSSP